MQDFTYGKLANKRMKKEKRREGEGREKKKKVPAIIFFKNLIPRFIAGGGRG